MRTLLCLFIFALPGLSAADFVATADTVESYVNVRSAPDAGADIVGRLYKGIPLPLVGSVPGWYEVDLGGGATGFVSADWSVVVAEETDGTAAPKPKSMPEAGTKMIAVPTRGVRAGQLQIEAPEPRLQALE